MKIGDRVKQSLGKTRGCKNDIIGNTYFDYDEQPEQPTTLGGRRW